VLRCSAKYIKATLECTGEPCKLLLSIMHLVILCGWNRKHFGGPYMCIMCTLYRKTTLHRLREKSNQSIIVV